MPTLKSQISSEDAIAKINELYHSRFTGSLVINASDNKIGWKIYFRLGRIIWAKGGSYPNLRWRRYSHLLHRPHLQEIDESTQTKNRQHSVLVYLYKKGNSIQQDKLIQLVKNVVSEILFDIIQYSVVGKKSLSYRVSAEDNLGAFLVLVDTEKILTQAMQGWIEWEGASLEEISPNSFPVIENAHMLQHRLSSGKYQHQSILSEIDGTASLRTIASKNNLNLIELAQFCLDLIKIGAISLLSKPTLRKLNVPIIIGSEAPDLAKYYQNNLIVSPPSSSSTKKKHSQPLIACVDDSLVICQSLGKIITRSGYRFIGIQDPVKAMLIIINSKPDLIFLDAFMSPIDGYELCSQLRKNPNFQNTPILFLTGKDNLKERIRAKLVGASGFIAKPARPPEILEAIRKHGIKVSG